MTKQEIVESIAREPKYLNMCRHVTGKKGEELAEDLHQELFICLMEMPEEKLIRVYQDNFSNYYFKMAARQYNSRSSRFHKVNIRHNSFLKTNGADISLFYEISQSERQGVSPELLRLFRQAMSELEQSNFVAAKLLQFIHENNVTIKQVAADTNVPLRSVYNITESAKKELLLKINRYKRMKK